MTKSEFQDLLHRYSSSTRKEAEQVLLLEKEYPYSQLLHSLAARVSKDHNFANQQSELQLAAIYAADRHVLKEIMSNKLAAHSNGGTLIQTALSTIDAIDYADEVMHDLEVLSETKHTFEMLFTEGVKKESSVLKTPVKKIKSADRPAAKKKVKTAVAKKKTKVVKAKKAPAFKKKPVKKTLKASTKPVAKKKIKPSAKGKKTKLLKKNVSGDSLITEIQNTKRELKPESPKQREQLQIIDQFIKAQPSISNARERAASVPTGDLASFIKQGEFGDQIISETLVDILIIQGKKDKAIDVLKKLIWKFPQKKAYFAAQIQELKK